MARVPDAFDFDRREMYGDLFADEAEPTEEPVPEDDEDLVDTAAQQEAVEEPAPVSRRSKPRPRKKVQSEAEGALAKPTTIVPISNLNSILGRN